MKNLLSLFFLSFLLSAAYADTIYLKNGRSIEGIVKSKNATEVELDIGSGTVKFLNSEIANISKSSSREYGALRKKWVKHKTEVQQRLAAQQLEEERKPRAIEFTRDLQGIVLDVRLDDKIDTKMVLDTGASITLISRSIAEKLGINLGKMRPDMKAQVADGRQVSAKHIFIDKVEVEGSVARKVEAAVLMEEAGNTGFGDGLLGMSFLNNFKFQVDHKEKKLLLEKY